MSEPLGEVMIRLGLDNSKFGSELDRSKRMVKYATSEMKANFSVMTAGGARVQALANKQRDLTNVIQAQSKVVNSLNTAYKNSFDENGKATRSTAGLATQLENAKSKLGGYQSQLQAVARESAKARVETTGITGEMNKIGKASSAAGTKLSSIGGKMTTRVTMPIVAGLTAATKSAIDFDSQIAQIGPLLTNGGRVTKKYQQQLDQMGESSKRWASQYGISTSVINDGMSELVKRGFTANQVIGSMPSVLDATMASGEDMGTVMQATASILEQFGLKSNNTSTQLKNTQRVTDSLTYAANATAAGFGDMSDAMSYVGPVAKSLNLSVEDTAAAIGVLSNQGIEGQKAGTNLRGILTSLVRITPNAAKELQKMGISSKQAGKDASDLPQLIDDITKGTKGWSAADKAKSMATIFGKQNQAAMNALIEAGSGSLRKLTKETENATGATKKVAEQMSQTKANQIKRTVENIKQMGITIGEQLLPLLPPLLKDINGMVSAFGRLDKGTQENIVRWLALAAAMGPVMKIGGQGLKIFGGLNTGIVGLISKLEQFKAGQAGVAAATKASAEAAGAMGTSVSEVGVSTKLFTALLSPAGLAIAGVSAALLLGKANWDIWGHAAYDSGERSRKWGSDVGKYADGALEKIKNASTGASEALAGFGRDGAQSAKDVTKEFSKMYKTIAGENEKQKSDMTKLYDSLPDSAKAAYKKTMDIQSKAADDRTAQAKTLNQKVKAITEESVKSGTKMTNDQKAVLTGYISSLQKISVDSLDVSAKQRKQIMQALKGDYAGMNDNDLAAMAGHFEIMNQKSAKLLKSSLADVREQYEKGNITKKAYLATSSALDSDYMAKQGQTIDARIKAERAAGMSEKAIWISMSRETGLSVNKLQSLYTKWQDSVTKSTSIASAAGNKAADDWNSIVLDPKTGKLKTNAQDEVTKAAKSEKTWKKLKYDLKHANLSTNAKQMITNAAIESGRWSKLSWKEKKAFIKTNTAEVAVKSLESAGAWDKLSFAQKEAVVNSNSKKAVAQAIIDAGQWSSLQWEEQKAMVTTNLGKTISESLQMNGVWNNLTFDQQKAIITSNSQDEVKDAVLASGQWNTLPWNEQMAVVKSNSAETAAQALKDEKQWNELNFAQQLAILTSNSKQETAQAVFDSGKWNELSWDQQDALVATNAGKTIMDALSANGTWANLSFEQQRAIVSSNSKEEIAQAVFDSGQWNTLDFKQQEAIVKNKASKELMNALNDAGTWNKLDVKTQQAVVQSKGMPELADSIVKMGNWNELPVDMKKLLVNDDQSKQKLIDAGIDITKFDTKMPLPKKLTADSAQMDKVLTDSGLKVDVINGKKVNPKNLNANNEDFISKVTQSNDLMAGYNSMDPKLKTLLAEDGDVVKKLNTSKSTLAAYNSLPPDLKQLIADTYGFDTKMDKSTGKLVFFDKNNPKGKTLTADDSDVSAKLADAGLKINQYKGNNPASKGLKGHDAGLNGALSIGGFNLENFKKNNPPSKGLKGHDAGLAGTLGTGKSLIGAYNSKNPNTKHMKARDEASGPASAASNAVDIFGRKKNHTVKLTTIIETISKNVKQKLGFAKGTNDFDGRSMAMVNDQKGSNFIELMQYPDNSFGFYRGRNVLLPDLPKHTKIFPAGLSAKMMPALKHYANGNEIPGNAEIVDLTQRLNSDSNRTVVVNGGGADVAKSNAKLDTLIGLMTALLEKDTDVYIDKQKVGRLVEPTVTRKQKQDEVTARRGLGYR